MIDQIKNIRLELDEISEALLRTFPNENSDLRMTTIKVDDAIKSVLLGKAWLGKLLEEFGNENPYKSGYKSVEDICETADKFHGDDILDSKGYIERIDLIRAWIKSNIDKVKNIMLPGVYSQRPHELYESKYANIAQMNAYTYLSNARFHLGFELQRIKQQA